jgi:thiol-disulfide isomerase/thioredoxin
MSNPFDPMSKTILAAPLKTLVFLLVTLSINAAAVASKAPSFELPSDSGTFSLEQYRNQVVYVDFWASWCVPCRHSFPWLNEMQARYGDAGFKVIGINVDKKKAKAQKFLELIPASFEIAYDPEGTVADMYSLKVMPSSFLIDQEGNLVHKHKGFKTSDGLRMEDMIKKLLDNKQ